MIKYLEHDIIKDYWPKHFVCVKCNTRIWINTNGEYYFYYRINNIGHTEKLNLTCSEVIIKKLLE